MPCHFRALHSGGGKDPLRHQCGKIAMGRPLQRQSEQGKPGVGIIKPFRRLQVAWFIIAISAGHDRSARDSAAGQYRSE